MTAYKLSDDLQSKLATLHAQESIKQKQIDNVVKLSTGIDERLNDAEQAYADANLAYLNDASKANKKLLDEAQSTLAGVKSDKELLPRLKSQAYSEDNLGNIREDIIRQANREINAQQSKQLPDVLKSVAEAKTAYLIALSNIHGLHQDAIKTYREVVEQCGIAYDDWKRGVIRDNKPTKPHVDLGTSKGKNPYYCYEPEINEALHHGKI